MTSSPEPCSAYISLQMLSDWRDQALKHSDHQFLREHLVTCTSCQSRLAGFDRVAAALRRQNDLEPKPWAWNHLQALERDNVMSYHHIAEQPDKSVSGASSRLQGENMPGRFLWLRC